MVGEAEVRSSGRRYGSRFVTLVFPIFCFCIVDTDSVVADLIHESIWMTLRFQFVFVSIG